MTNKRYFPSEDDKMRVASWFVSFQEELCAILETVDEAASALPSTESQEARFSPKESVFSKEPWDRFNEDDSPGGGGVMRMMRGHAFEKAGVHTSRVSGVFSEDFARKIQGARLDSREFWATGVSVILHPWNPHVPTAHMNARFVVTSEHAWFGGGADLTPTLARRRQKEDKDAMRFHQAMEKACLAHTSHDEYLRYKKWCDEYFFIKHRKENRGVGGVFFDDLNSGQLEEDFSLAKSISLAFKNVYVEIVRANYDTPWTQEERHEQQVWRGRYVEFNLLYDRGTTFGLKTGGNIEAILSSLPPTTRWP